MKKRKLKKLLKQALQQLAAGQAAANDPAPAVEGPTMAEWLVTYRSIIAQRGYNPQTIKNRTTCIRHVEAAWGSMPLRAVRPVDISTALKQWSPHTAVRVLGELRDIYVEAIANGAAESSPAAHVKRPKAPGLRKRLTLETWQAKTSPQRWVKALLLLAPATVQTLLGHKDAEMTALYLNDRGLTDGEWKRVSANDQLPVAA